VRNRIVEGNEREESEEREGVALSLPQPPPESTERSEGVPKRVSS